MPRIKEFGIRKKSQLRCETLYLKDTFQVGREELKYEQNAEIY